MVSLNQKRQIFRDEALKQADSPEQLDRLIQVTSPRRWLSLAAFTILITAGSAWSVLAKIPITVSGKGIVVYPSKVQTVQSNTAGVILDIKVKPDEVVKKGQVLATIDQSDLKQKFQLAQVKLEYLEKQNRDATDLQRSTEIRTSQANDDERAVLQKTLETVQSMSPLLKRRGLDASQVQRAALQQQLQTLQESVPIYKSRAEKRNAILKEGAISADVAMQAENDYKAAQTKVNEVEVQLKQLDIKDAQAQQEDLNNLSKVDEIRAKIETLTAQKVGKTEQDYGAYAVRQKEIEETKRTIKELTMQLEKSSEILSTQDGRLIEVIAKAGQRVEPGAGIGTIATQAETDKLQSLVFLDAAEAKKVDAARTSAHQKQAKLQAQITPTTVKVEEYGGIIGHVEDVLKLPVTPESAASLVGSPNMLKGVIAENTSQMVIVTSLQCRDGQSSQGDCPKYQWSGSKGPDQALTSGTTTNVRITIEERAPITYLLPFLKNLMGK
jgi:HlyD family secretion protein